tara:strand:- start:47 stop:553 length:507 start_codon:yes stop_codon:yes gene_type:complete
MSKIINISKKSQIKKKYNQLDCSLNNLYSEQSKFYLNNQIILINKLYLNEDFTERKELTTNLNNKINSYKQQDIKRNIHDDNTLILFENLIEKLLLSRLKCYYCKNNLYLFYLNIREKYQWTLDRINNNKNHSNENTLISCLECNLKRRVQNKDAFLFTKQLKIKKQN